MAKDSGIEAIKARQQEIALEISALQKEYDELESAIRVFQRFAAPPEPESKLGPPRPSGIPSLFIMASTILREAEEGHLNGLTGREIVEEIGRRFWPGVQGPQILPSIYQFAKNGRLRKSKDGRFHTPRKNETPSELSEGASGTGEAQAPSH